VQAVSPAIKTKLEELIKELNRRHLEADNIFKFRNQPEKKTQKLKKKMGEVKYRGSLQKVGWK